MYKLYYSPGACSKAPHIALHETGAEHEAIRVQLHNPAGPDKNLLAANPRLQVPVLDDGGQIIREGAAILIYILDKEQSPLLPATGTERGRALEWLCWCNASLHPAYGAAFAAPNVYKNKSTQDDILAMMHGKIQKMWDDADAHLAKNKYLAGSDLTIGDILMTVIGQWKVPGFGDNQPVPGPNVQRVFKDVISRPSWAAATAMEEGQKKAA